jgi:hypothetical protein
VRFLKLIVGGIIAAAAVLVGLVVAAVAAVAAAVFLLVRRPRVTVRTATTRPMPPRPASAGGDVIDISATEVPASPADGAITEVRSGAPR